MGDFPFIWKVTKSDREVNSFVTAGVILSAVSFNILAEISLWPVDLL